ncbi:MAG: hypothetical protein D4R58_00685 [Betaproteobacteria bacterium]|nr:MAG: hypothetical protein D4R58_00685 [Betaproteobacteria bacterium]
MLWFKQKPLAQTLPVAGDTVVPLPLPVALDSQIFKYHFDQLLEQSGAEGGIAALIERMQAKQQAVVATFERALAAAGLSEIESLLDQVFTARRRLYPALESAGVAKVREALAQLRHDALPVAARLQAFVDAMPGTAGLDRASLKAANKLRRAAWDFAAELLHFIDPDRFPLMTRWVWDQSTQSGALREFIRGNDSMQEIPLTNAPEMFEGARAWLADQLRTEGIYRDLPLWIDLMLAQAYTNYLRSVAEGNLGAEFGRGTTPGEQLAKLLGIDRARRTGMSRVKKDSLVRSAA